MKRLHAACSRRLFLFSLPAACAAASTSRGRVLPSAEVRYPDPSTEFPVYRLTNPSFTSRLPAHYGRVVSRRGTFLLHSSDETGRMEVFRLDYKTGSSRQLTDAEDLSPNAITLGASERNFYYFDAGALWSASLQSLHAREVYRAPEGFLLSGGFAVSEDELYATLVERKDTLHRLRLIRIADGTASTIVEADEELRDAVPRPRRASILYRRGGEVWLANYDGQQNFRLKLAEGRTETVTWGPDGRTVLYLNTPADPRKLHNIRELTPDTNEERQIANTSQFIAFERNGDGSVFVGASGSKASPHILLLVRAVKREFTLCEHRSSILDLVSPVFSPNSQRIFFGSDQHGKPAIYSMVVENLVSETDSQPEQ